MRTVERVAKKLSSDVSIVIFTVEKNTYASDTVKNLVQVDCVSSMTRSPEVGAEIWSVSSALARRSLSV